MSETPRKSLSTYQVAKLCDVHHTTVINWVNVGKLKAYTTPGGHRRILREDLVDFMEDFKIPVPEDLKRVAKRILVVDDEVEALEEMRDALAALGYELLFARDGFEAGRKIYSKTPNLILLDFKMPGMDGFDVCKILKEDEETKHIPIFAVTALTSSDDKKKIRACGVTKYIPKPIDMEKLIESIEKLFGS